MSESSEKFKRFREEHARLHDPALVRGAVELVPVDLREILSNAASDSRKKKKKRHGGRAGFTLPQMDEPPMVDPPEDERLLPLAFIQQLRGLKPAPTPPKTPSRAKEGETAQSEPRMGIEPQSVTRTLSLFQEQVFAVVAPAAQQVELVWSEQQPMPGKNTTPQDATEGSFQEANKWSTQLQRVVMDHQEGDRFAGQIGLPDGKYLVAFAVDGRTHPPQHLAQRIVINRAGVFAPLTLARHKQVFVVSNAGRTDERVSLETQTPWIVPEGSPIELAAGASAKITVRFDPSRMKPALNEGLLHFKVQRGDEMLAAGVVQVAINLEIGGAVGGFSFLPRDFGEIRQGLDDLLLEVEVKARGLGVLNGMISLPQSGELVDFRLDAADEATSRFAHTFQINSAHLALPQPNTAEAVLKVMLLTDSFLANYRLCRFEIPYRLVYLKKSLPALSFGTIRTGSTRTMRLQVARSDARDIELAVTLPPAVDRFLEAYPARNDVYVFRLDASHLPPGTIVDESIEVIDRKSGLRDHIKLLAAITQSVTEPARTVADMTTS